MERKESQARALLDKTNRQFNGYNALYRGGWRCGPVGRSVLGRYMRW